VPILTRPGYNPLVRIGFDMQALVGGGETGLGAYARGVLWGMERLALTGANAAEIRRDIPGRAAEALLRKQGWPKGVEIARLYPNRLEKPLAHSVTRTAWEQSGLPASAKSARADVVYSPALGAPLGRAIPNVATVHDLIPLHKKDREIRLAELYFTEYLPRCWRKADMLVFDTETVRAEFLGRWPDVKMDRTLVVPCFAACRVPKLFPPTSGGIWEPGYLAGIATSEPVQYSERRGFLCVATFEERKNLGLALDAYAQLAKDIREKHPLIMIGKGGERDILWQLVEQSGMARFVKFTGYLPIEQLRETYAKALALVFPSTDEGFGIPPLEAMSYGTPAVIGDAPAVREVYGAVCPSVARDGAGNLSGEMARLAKHEEHWKKLSENGLRFAAGFSPERTALVAMAACEMAASSEF
jgi:glycosyltransferase involved in cell wall biosynthesis